MANTERNIEHPINNEEFIKKIRTIYFSGKPHRQVERYALSYAKSALTYYWLNKPQTEDEQELRISEINRWSTAVEWYNAGASDKLIIALSQDANHLRHEPERTQYEIGVALGNIAGLLTQLSSGLPAKNTHTEPIMIK